jgi:hypothetical protein
MCKQTEDERRDLRGTAEPERRINKHGDVQMASSEVACAQDIS